MITRITQLVTLISIFIASIIVRKQMETGRVPSIRRLPAIDALEEAVGRAVELGRPVHATTGYGRGTLQHTMSAAHFAGMAIIAHLATLTAKMGAKLIVTMCPPEAIPMVDGSIRDAYVAEGKIEDYSPDTIRHFGTLQWGYTIGVLGLLNKEKPASNILVGPFLAESLVIGESGARIGAYQIGGGGQVQFLITCCNYVLIGEELYAASAYLTKDPNLVSTIRVQDIGRIVIIGMLLLVVLFATAGSNWLVNLLKL